MGKKENIAPLGANLVFKFVQDSPEDKLLDFEMMGKILDNILIVADKDKKPMSEGRDYSIEFEVGHMNKYTAHIHVYKQYIQFKVSHVSELTKKEQRISKMRKQAPKVERELNKLASDAKKKMEEAKKSDKKK